jgi:hypothetical protein
MWIFLTTTFWKLVYNSKLLKYRKSIFFTILKPFQTTKSKDLHKKRKKNPLSSFVHKPFGFIICFGILFAAMSSLVAALVQITYPFTFSFAICSFLSSHYVNEFGALVLVFLLWFLWYFALICSCGRGDFEL